MKQSCYQQGCSFTMPCFSPPPPPCGCNPCFNPAQNFCSNCGCNMALPLLLIFAGGVLIGCQCGRD